MPPTSLPGVHKNLARPRLGRVGRFGMDQTASQLVGNFRPPLPIDTAGRIDLAKFVAGCASGPVVQGA